MTQLDQQLTYLYQLRTRGMKLGLDNMKELLNKLGNPHKTKNIKFIHITGTNGKGSVSAMLSSILTKAGKKVGMFTSPHLINVTERIKINDQPITEERLLAYIQNARPYIDEIGNTFFETINAIAFQYFADEAVEYAIIEVGLGGMHDSTNVIQSKIAILTDIKLDHCHILGNKIEDITKDKCGIIKEQCKVITSNKGTVLDIIKKTCQEKNVELYTTDTTASFTNLRGTFQKQNVALAEQAAKLLEIKQEHILSGLQQVKWPGRMQYITYENQSFLVDCAHNPAAFTTLWDELTKNQKKKIIILSMCKEKDIEQCLTTLKDEKHTFILTKADIERATDPEQLRKYLPRALLADNLEDAVDKALQINRTNEQLIVITGSIFLVGEFLALTQKVKCYPIGY